MNHGEDNVLTGDEIVINSSRRAKQRNTIEMNLHGCW